MQIRVLGCHGGETPGHLPTSFLLDSTVALDAGALCRCLRLDEQHAITDVLLSHAHLDHIKDLALLAEQSSGRREQALTIHCGTETAKALKTHFFNGVIWPDFTVIPTRSKPTVRIKSHPPARKFKVAERFDVTFIPVTHPIESMGMLIEDENSAMLFSSDTGPTEKIWKTANRCEKLRTIFVELSFPNHLQELADLSGHLTPSTLKLELAKLSAAKLDVFLYHLKPAYLAETKRELRLLRDDRVHVLADGDAIKL